MWEITREWLRIGLTGFGGPPAHIALLRRLVVEAWQLAVLATAAAALLLLRQAVVPTLVAAGIAGVVLALAGAPLPG
jgi:hypothetical protein